jgi:hypothetical protein
LFDGSDGSIQILKNFKEKCVRKEKTAEHLLRGAGG